MSRAGFAGSPKVDELAALARKYRSLSELRRDFQSTGNTGDPSALRALAREFPGALRELDTLPLTVIEERAKLLDEAAAGLLAAETWMTWMVAYHAMMRAALLVKARLVPLKAGRPKALAALDPGVVRAIASDVSAQSGTLLDGAFVAAVARPPGGRINRMVFDRLGEAFGVAPDVIWDALFPSRRPGRGAKRLRT